MSPSTMEPSIEPALRITALRVRYIGHTDKSSRFSKAGIDDAGNHKEALRGLDLEVKPGRIYALLGPNGAGKTTLLRCLTGLLCPTSGSLQILGTEIAGESSASKTFPDNLRNQMGVLIESPAAYGRMTAREYLRFFAGFYSPEISPANIEARIQELAAAFELESLTVRIGKLSQGNRQKVQLMRSLLHHPRLVLWDEPTEHLDPRAQRLVLAHLRAYVAAGASALVTSHRLEQMEDTAHDYGFLRRGALVHSLSHEQLSATLDEVEIEGLGSLDNAVVEDFSLRFEHASVLSPNTLRVGQWGLRLRSQGMLHALPDVIHTLMQSGGRVARVEPMGRSLESLYRHYVEDAA